jgi:hypothetical protein
VTDQIFDALSTELKSLAKGGSIEGTVQDLLVEAAAVVATYNMVCRFLLSLDVAGISKIFVPWPFDRAEVR